MSDRLRGWMTGLERDLFRYSSRDWLKCWVKGYARVKGWVRGLVFVCVNGWVIGCESKRFGDRYEVG